MMEEHIKAIVQPAIVIGEINFRTAKNDSNYCSFVIRKGKKKFLVTCFDDERENAPYKRIKNANLKPGTVLNLECEMILKDRKLVSDEDWKKMSDKPNPTNIEVPQFKIIDFSFAIPLEYHKKEKQKLEAEEGSNPKPALKPLTDLSRFGGKKGE